GVRVKPKALWRCVRGFGGAFPRSRSIACAARQAEQAVDCLAHTRAQRRLDARLHLQPLQLGARRGRARPASCDCSVGAAARPGDDRALRAHLSLLAKAGDRQRGGGNRTVCSVRETAVGPISARLCAYHLLFIRRA
ncbi:hypothetical protein T492DRAFT_1125089, partial [Pavlovales sp. CCMP2436]